MTICHAQTTRFPRSKGCLVAASFNGADVGTIRLKCLKIGAVVLPNTRRVRLLMPKSCPYQGLFRDAADHLKLKPGSSPWAPGMFVGAILAQGVARLECA